MTIKQFLNEFEDIVKKIRKKRIVVMLGGFGEEREASIYTGEQVFKALKDAEFNSILIDPSTTNITKLLNSRTDIVFNCLHGSFGESGHLPAILDYLKIPYTFSGIYPSVVTMDKLYFSSIVKKLGVLIPQDNIDNPDLISGYKDNTILKKIRGGGSIGMKISTTGKVPEAFFCQKFINEGNIITLGILESKNIYIPLGIVEVKLKDKEFYDQDSKYLEGFSSYIKYKGKNSKLIIDESIKIFKFLSIKGAARIDFIERKNKIYLLEINSVPGLYEDSNLVYSASLSGLSFYQLVIWILSNSGFEKLL